jgi:hypothetical protein
VYTRPKGETLKHKLELDTVSRVSHGGGNQDESHQPYTYTVQGLPEGEAATIFKNRDGSWEVGHSKNGVVGSPMGSHESPEAALAVLQKEY